MRLLFLLPRVPEPPDSGAAIRNRGLLQAAAERHEVDAIAFGQRHEEPALHALVERGVVVPEPPAKPRPARLAGMLASPGPDLAWRFHSAAFEDAVRRRLAERRYDSIQAEGLEMAGYLAISGEAGGATIYDAHNAEHLLQQRAAEADWRTVSLRDLAATVYSRVQSARLRRYEAAVVRSASLVLAVSNHDANQLEALAPWRPPVRVVPNAVDLERFPYREQPPERPPALLFLGKLDYRPNAEAVKWLLSEIMPAVFRSAPDCRLFVVGAHPPRWLVQAGQTDNRIAVVGWVNDERPYVQRASAMLLPFRVGGGSRLKALVAMASGTAVISTAVGIEGLDAEPGRDFLLANTPTEWIDAVARTCSGSWRPGELIARARALVESRYSWSAVGERLIGAYETLVRS